MAGIATALVLGVPSLVVALVAVPDPYDAAMRPVQWAGKAAHCWVTCRWSSGR
jgi:hypothetical protein